MEEKPKLTGRGKVIDIVRQKAKNLGQQAAEEQDVQQAGDSQRIHTFGRGPRAGKARGELKAQFSAKVTKETPSPSEEPCSTSGLRSEPDESKKAEEDITSLESEVAKLQLEQDGVKLGVDKMGKYGEPVDFTANYVYLQCDDKLSINEYEVSFTPEVSYITYRYQLIYRLFPGRKDAFCYDGSSKLCTPERITTETLEFTSEHPATDDAVVLRIRFLRPAKKKDCATVYNMLFNNCARMIALKRFGDRYYDFRAAVRVPIYKLEIWPGFVTAVREVDGGLELCCNICHRILRSDTPYDVLSSIVRRQPEDFKVLVAKELLGQCVITRYNSTLYRIDDIDWSSTPLSTFKLSSGDELTFVDYYKRQYNLDIKDLKQPLLINRRKDRLGKKTHLVCLIPELCNLTGLTDPMRKDMKLMKEVLQYTRVTPIQRVHAFKQFLRNIKSNVEATKLLSQWGLAIMNKPVVVKGRNIGSEPVLFGNGKMVIPVDAAWRDSLRNMAVYRSVALSNWLFLYPGTDTALADTFLRLLFKVGPGLGMDISPPVKIALQDNRTDSYVGALRTKLDSRKQMVVLLCPNIREDRYSAIKKICCYEKDIASQVVTCAALSRRDRVATVVLNVALQINSKLGGACWAIRIPFKNTMVCGMDTYHDKNRKCNSVGGFVASMSNDFTEWFSKANLQGPKEEMVSDLVSSFGFALESYRDKNHVLPDRIIIYRDGLSDGELEICREFEISQFLQLCKAFRKNYQPKFTFVIVRKRISTKFYEFSEKDSSYNNPLPGSVIDSGITRKDRFDFFLVSQQVRMGTANPTHYIVLYDNSNIEPDHIQRVTYKFCHLYYNWPGTIRVPAPCLYAHKLAYLVGKSVREVPSEGLDHKLYYL